MKNKPRMPRPGRWKNVGEGPLPCLKRFLEPWRAVVIAVERPGNEHRPHLCLSLSRWPQPRRQRKDRAAVPRQPDGDRASQTPTTRRPPPDGEGASQIPAQTQKPPVSQPFLNEHQGSSALSSQRLCESPGWTNPGKSFSPSADCPSGLLQKIKGGCLFPKKKK